MNNKNFFIKSKKFGNNNEEIDSLKYIFLKWVDSLTLHGIPNLIRTKHTIMKILWAIAFIISSGLCAYMTYSGVTNYFQYDVVTKIKTIEENPIYFPTVTICNINPFVTEESLKFTDNYIKENFNLDINDILNGTPSYDLMNSPYKLFERYFFYTFTIQQKVGNVGDGLKKKLLFPFKNLFISCFFALMPCTESDFVSYFDMLRGTCFKFNSGKYLNGSKAALKTSRKLGKLGGLMLELFVGDSSDPRSLSITSGAHIFIHNDSLTPTTFEGFEVSSGTLNNVIVSKTYVSKLQKPYSDCIDGLDNINSFDSELFRVIMSTNNSYRRSDCLNLCYQRKMFKECKCYDGTLMPYSKKVGPCITAKETMCGLKVFEEISRMGVDDLCSKECPLECNSITYSHSVSSTLFPAKSYAHNMLKDPNIISKFSNKTVLNYESLKESTLAINIYFDKFESISIQEIKQTEFVEFIAGIGGTLGLFLGISVLSLFEFFEIFLEISFVL